MILFKKAAELRKWLDAQQKKGNSIGFVPTMGALHEGHISLIRRSKKANQVTVSSIFINPAQFNDSKDFEKYPITLELDIAKLEEDGCDVLFLPSVSEMYPDGLNPQRHYDLGYLETVLEGKFRPGHFQGVCLVVHRLLDIVVPDRLYLGQKDYQQCMVIKKLLELVGLSDKITLVICHTLREHGGLAMSSRNMRLTAYERNNAAIIYQTLQLIKENTRPGDTGPVRLGAKTRLEKAGLRVDYVELADAGDLTPVTEWDGKQKLVALIAAYLGEVRLIDNLLLN